MRKLAAVAVASLALLAVACTPEEHAAWTSVNDLRVANGLPQLRWEEGAYEKARSWSEHMARQGRLSHSVLSQGVPDDWQALGENVAVHKTLEGALDALERSPAHRANILNPRFDRIAVGVVHAGGRYWVTQVFLG